MMRQQSPAFSLVEVTIAIGIFAFVIVGVMGLLPAGMRMRADSTAETRGVLISEELFAAVRAAPNLSNVAFRIGPKLIGADMRTNNILEDPVVLGYPLQTTIPLWFYWQNPASSWANANGGDPEIAESITANSIETLARLSATNLGNSLYQVSVEVRTPASIARTNSRSSVFSTLVYSP